MSYNPDNASDRYAMNLAYDRTLEPPDESIYYNGDDLIDYETEDELWNKHARTGAR